MKKYFLLMAMMPFICYAGDKEATEKIGTGIVVTIVFVAILGLINWLKSLGKKNQNS